MKDAVFISFQVNDETRSLVDAIVSDNPDAQVTRYPAMVKVDAPQRLVIRRETVEELTGREYDLRELQLNLISICGNIEESDDEFVLHWNNV